MRKAILTAALFLASAFATAAPFGHYKPAPQYEEAVTTSLYLPMRDGVRLALSISRPAKDGKPVEGRFPVIWHHTLAIAGPGASGGPVGDTPRGHRDAPLLVRQGYVVVQVARRGQGPSFGVRRGYNDRTEAYDAYEVIDWLAAQPWSTGSVGVYGCSNTGDAAMHAVTAANPHLKAAWAGCFSWEKYDGFLRGGIFANWGTGPERSIADDLKNTPVQGDEDKRLLRQAAEEHQAGTVLRKMWEGMPFRDDYAPAESKVGSRFWYEGSVAAYRPQMLRSGTAVYVQGGWHDDLRGQGLITWANLRNQDRRILIGPWGHCENGDFDMLSEMQRFFDQHLKKVDTGLLADDPVHYFTVNAPAGREWRSAKTWPVPGAAPQRWFLSSANGQLARQQQGEGAGTKFTVRYDLDCPGMKRRPDGLLTGFPPCPQEHAGPRFDTPPLAADTELTGDALADLTITASTPDAQVFVYLEDVAPDGRVTQVTDARLKASLRKTSQPPYENFGLPWHRAHREDEQLLKPGEPVRLSFAFLPISHIFKAGHRIRVSVAGADYRERNLTPIVPAPVITILDGSSVTLPIMGVQPETTRGQLPDGTPYRIDMPPRWNGTVLVGLDYAGRDPMAPDDAGATSRALLDAGFAMAGTTRTVTGWAIHQAAANAVRTLDLFESKYGKPKHAVEFGSSQGGHTAAVALQAYPQRWSGALPVCPGLAGSIGQWQAKFDALFAAKALLAPQSSLPVTGIPKDWQTTALPAWQQMLNAARQTPQGRARIALAATLGQLPDWADPAKPRPAADDLAAREAGLIDSLLLPRALLAQAMSSRAQIEALAGGNVSGNVGVDYAKLLREADREGLIARLYERAGLDLKADLAMLARAPRVNADPKAVAYMATGVFDGRLPAPVLTLSAIGDPISAVAGQEAYERAARSAGKADLLHQLYTASAGHCGFKPAETVAAVQTLMQRIETGAWPATDARAMNRGDSTRFIDFQPPRFQRAYSACDLKRNGATPVRAEGQTLPECTRP